MKLTVGGHESLPEIAVAVFSPVLLLFANSTVLDTALPALQAVIFSCLQNQAAVWPGAKPVLGIIFLLVLFPEKGKALSCLCAQKLLSELGL